MKRFIAGFDIGGTKIAVSVGTRSGRILRKKVFFSGKSIRIKESIDQIQPVLSELLKKVKITKRDLLGIGVAAPGAIDPNRERILKSPNLPAWEKVPLRRLLTRAFQIPIWLENDANAAALGEQYFGLGRGINDFIYVTVSTGIGSGIVANGFLLRGASGMAGEVGHMTIVPAGLLCPCGKKGCLEAYASGTAIANHTRQLLKQGLKSRFFKNIPLKKITGQLVGEAARAKDPVAIQARLTAADFLGIGLANLINVLNPKRIILGGGVTENLDYIWTPMMKALKREAWPISLRACQVVKSKLGKKVGDLGAIAIILDAARRGYS
jgi:glucokinase